MATKETQLFPQHLRSIITIRLRHILPQPYLSRRRRQDPLLPITFRHQSQANRYHNPIQRPTSLHNKFPTEKWTNIIKEPELLQVA